MEFKGKKYKLVYKGIANTGERCDDWVKKEPTQLNEWNALQSLSLRRKYNPHFTEPGADFEAGLVKEPTEYGCLMLTVPFPGWLKFIIKYIDSNDLFLEKQSGGLEDYSHVTVAYGFEKDVDISNIKDYINNQLSIGVNIWFQDISVFEAEDHDVVKFSIVSEELKKMNEWCKDTYTIHDTFPDYKPHMTIGYVKKGLGKKYVKKLKSLPMQRLVCKEFKFSFADGTEELIHMNEDSTKFKNSVFSSYLTSIEKTLKSKAY